MYVRDFFLEVEIKTGQLILRRRLLFKLLRNFDFDRPQFGFERAVNTMHPDPFDPISDTFIFKC